MAAEFALLWEAFPDILYEPAGHWFMIPSYPLSSDGPSWTPVPMPVAFHAQPGHPGQAPYGIWVPSGVRVSDQPPNNIKDPANKQPPFPGRWAVLSWAVDGKDQWRPKADVGRGSNLLNYARSFQQRFGEGR